MCTLIALHRCTPAAGLVVAANRDEFYARPAEGPAVRDAAAGRVVAPKDLRAGGTWLGINRRGLFTAITNRPSQNPDRSRRSRGLLVMDALAERSARDAAERFAELPAGAYNPFNLFVADAEQAFVVCYEEKARLVALAPGAHVIGNADPDDRSVPKVARLLDRVERLVAEGSSDPLAELREIVKGHEGMGGPLDDTCIHTDSYGTRSSTLLMLADESSGGVLQHAEGPPCETPYEDRSHLLREL